MIGYDDERVKAQIERDIREAVAAGLAGARITVRADGTALVSGWDEQAVLDRLRGRPEHFSCRCRLELRPGADSEEG